MTHTAEPTTPTSAEVVEVADTFVQLMRSFNRARARMLAAAAHDVEWSASVLLKCLANDGPMRAGALAECLQSDPSTISRQVAGLVKDGLLERRADPEDGRASILALTPEADAVLTEHDEIKFRHFATMLSGWSEQDLRRFAALLRQFTKDFENANNDALRERIAARSAARGGKY